MRRIIALTILLFTSGEVFSQLKWVNVDSLFQPLPPSVHVFRCSGSLEGKPNIAYYVEADLDDKELFFSSDTSKNRRLTPSQFFAKNDKPLVVVNCTFFSFETNQNLNVVIKNGHVVSRNLETVNKRIGDTVVPVRIYRSAIGINKKRRADIAWTKTDSTKSYAEAAQEPVTGNWQAKRPGKKEVVRNSNFSKWKMETAVGGGPVLVQKGKTRITNEEENRFAGKAIADRHPRTAMGYTKDGKLIILVVEGRNPGTAEGASLTALAKIFTDLNCHEALNLDGGGSSCMLVNGKQTIKTSDRTGERPVPAVFIIGTTE